MPTDLSRFENELARRWARDLSTCTEEELLARWDGPDRIAADRIDPIGFARRVANHNPIYFIAQRCWFDNVADDPRFLYAPLHRDIFCKEIVEYIIHGFTDVRGYVYEGPRDSFKSTLQGAAVMWVAFRWKHLLNRDATQAMTHHKEKMASQNLVRIKEKFQKHKWVRETWPEFCPDPEVKWGNSTEVDFPCKDDGSSVAESSIMAAGLGASQTGGHFTVRWNDDIVTEDHMKSRVLREDTAMRYGATRFTRDLSEGREVNTGTRYHINDLWAKLEKSKMPDGTPMYRVVVVDAEDMYMDGSKQLAHPFRLNAEVLEGLRVEEEQRNGNDLFYWLQMRNQPKASLLVATDLDWIKYCGIDDIHPGAWRCILVDPAWKGTDSAGEGDYACIAVMFFERNGALIKRYFVDGVHSNMLTQHEGTDEIFRLMRRYGVIDVAPEEHGSHQFRQYLKDQGAMRGQYINIIDLKSRFTAKPQRITTFVSHIQAGHFWMVKDNPLRQEFESCYEDYPQVEHDDILDAPAYSCDEEIAKRIAPMFNPYVASQNAPPPRERRTRHCAR